MSYTALDEKSNIVAVELLNLGIKKGDYVPVCMNSSMEFIITIFAAIKVGAIYIPIAPQAPENYKEHILEDINAKLILCSSITQSLTAFNKLQKINIDDVLSKNAQLETQVTFPKVTNQDPIYVIYTSGTTGKPKGSISKQESVLRVAKNTNYINISSFDKVIQLSNVAFDGSVFDIFGALLNGAELVLLSEEKKSDVKLLGEVLVEQKISIMFVTTALFNTLVDIDVHYLKNIEKLLFGGEQVSYDHVKKAFEVLGANKIIHVYGPTETTVYASFFPINSVSEYAKNIPIGKPITNTQIKILDRNLSVVPMGVPGELYISGSGLAKGYLGRPDLTSQSFISDPYLGSKMYKTGDLGRLLPSGDIEFLGRIDHQVKIRGFRIELSGISHQIMKHSSVTQSLVLAYGEGSDKYLVAYYTGSSSLTSEELRSYLKQELPFYMIPLHYIYLETFPLTRNGKISRRALPLPEASTELEYVGATNPIEEALVSIYSEVLGHDPRRLSVTRSFFDLGGHSLRAMVLLNKLSKSYNRRLTLRDIFLYQDIRSMGIYLSGESEGSVLSDSIPQASPSESYPLSSVQRRLYFLYEFSKTSLTYNMPRVLQLSGRLDLERLQRSFEGLVSRHEVLRTYFKLDSGVPVQCIGSSSLFSIEHIHCNQEELSDKIEGFIRPFDLNTGPLFRVGVVTVSEEEHYLMMDIHHIIMDGVSQGVLINDFMSFYQGEDLPEIELHYKDYSEWEQSTSYQTLLSTQGDYWQSVYEDLPVALELPLDRSRPIHRNHLGGRKDYVLSNSLSESLERIAKAEGCTMFMLLLSSYVLLLQKLSGSEDIVVGVPVSGRTHADVEKMLGMFVNTLALRYAVDLKSSYRDYLSKVKDLTLSYFSHQEYPYEDLVDGLQLDRDPSRNPLFDVMFSYEDFEPSELKLSGMELSDYDLGQVVSKFDLTLTARKGLEGVLGFSIEYAEDIFESSTVDRIWGYYNEILEHIVSDLDVTLGSISVLDASSRKELLETFNGEDVVYTEGETVLDLFDSQVQSNPEAMALFYEGSSLSYRELWERSNQLANYLQSKGVREGEKIGICIDRSLEMIVGILGILRSGSAYVPIDPSYPSERIGYILEDISSRYVLSSKALKETLSGLTTSEVIALDTDDWLDNYPTTLPEVSITRDSLVYIIYTSGTTGRPKGVLISHENLMISNLSRLDYYNKIKSSLLISSFAFDSSIAVIWESLTVGAALFVASNDTLKDSFKVNSLIQEHKIESLLCIPSYYNLIIEDSIFKSGYLKRVIVAGESLKKSLIEKHNQVNEICELYNEYGPTENSVWATVDHVKKDTDKVVIGKPIKSTKVYILDKNLEILPIGREGELYLGGKGVAQGYLNAQELTQSKFIENPFQPEEIIYKTGDLGKWLPNGTIEFLGRIDDQVKINGHRIELREIQHQLSNFKNVVESEIILKTVNSIPSIVAYYTSSNDIDLNELKEHMYTKLPNYMVPEFYIQLEEFPLSVNGKLDKKRLPEPNTNTLKDLVYPKSEEEKLMAKIWATTLDLPIEKIGVNTSFFSLGGNSLLIMKLRALIRNQMHVNIELKDFFERITIKQLVDYMSIQKKKEHQLPLYKKEDYALEIPLSFSQERLWFIDKYYGSSDFHIPMVFKVKGSVNVELLNLAFKKIVERHKILRTIILNKENKLFQKIIDEDYWSLNEMNISEDIEDLDNLITKEIQRPFNLSSDYMLRANLFIVGVEKSILVITMHHIASDGWSLNILFDELSKVYNALIQKSQVELEPLPIQYSDYAIWQKSSINNEENKEKVNYWEQKLKGLDTSKIFTNDESDSKSILDTGVHKLILDKTIKKEANYFIKTKEVTLYVFLLSALKVLLHKYSHKTDLCIGTPVVNRTHPGTESLIGFFLNTLALRSTFESHNTFNEVLEIVKTTAVDAFNNQEIPYEKVLEVLKLSREKETLFQIFFNQTNQLKQKTAKIDELDVSIYKEDWSVSSKFDLSFYVFESEENISIDLVYNTKIFSKNRIASIAEHYKLLIVDILKDSNKSLMNLNYLTKEELVEQENTLNDFFEAF